MNQRHPQSRHTPHGGSEKPTQRKAKVVLHFCSLLNTRWYHPAGARILLRAGLAADENTRSAYTRELNLKSIAPRKREWSLGQGYLPAPGRRAPLTGTRRAPAAIAKDAPGIRSGGGGLPSVRWCHPERFASAREGWRSSRADRRVAMALPCPSLRCPPCRARSRRPLRSPVACAAAWCAQIRPSRAGASTA